MTTKPQTVRKAVTIQSPKISKKVTTKLTAVLKLVTTTSKGKKALNPLQGTFII